MHAENERAKAAKAAEEAAADDSAVNPLVAPITQLLMLLENGPSPQALCPPKDSSAQ